MIVMNRPPARRAHRHLLAAAAASLLLSISPAQAGPYINATLTNYVPQAGQPLNDMLLVALHNEGPRYQVWNRTSGTWGPWVWTPYWYGTFPWGGDDKHLPLVSWDGFADGEQRTFGLYTGSVSLGSLWWTHEATSFGFDIDSQPVDGHGSTFFVDSGVARRTDVQYVHFFGRTTPDPNCGAGLREHWWDAGTHQWNWAYHGCPRSGVPVSMGGQSAVATEQVPYSLQHTFLFATAVPADGEADLWVRHASTARPYRNQGEAWRWFSLGRPPGTTQMSGWPLAISYDRGNHVWRTHVFVTALNSADGLFHLYERYTDGDNWTAFSGWGDHGTPPGLNTQATADHRFQMSTGVVRYENGVLHIGLYGSSWHQHLPKPADSGQLVEYFWNGSRWAWGWSDESPERNSDNTPTPLKVTSSTTGRLQRRVSIVAITDNGNLWERVWDTAGNWSWVRH